MLLGKTPQGTHILVPTDVKKQYRKSLNSYIKQTKTVNKKYKDVTDLITTHNGQDYITVLLQDKKTGEGYAVQTKLNVQRN